MSWDIPAIQFKRALSRIVKIVFFLSIAFEVSLIFFATSLNSPFSDSFTTFSFFKSFVAVIIVFKFWYNLKPSKKANKRASIKLNKNIIKTLWANVSNQSIEYSISYLPTAFLGIPNINSPYSSART